MRYQGKYWIGVLNNPEEIDEQRIRDLEHSGYLIYGIAQLEMGKGSNKFETEGTVHFQCYFAFNKNVTIKKIKELLENKGWHLERRMGSHKQASDYCKKTDTRIVHYEEFGDYDAVPDKQGQRNDMIAIRDGIIAGVSLNDLEMEYFGTFMRYNKSILAFAEKIENQKWENKEKTRIKTVVLRNWQKRCRDELLVQNDREVMWVWELTGNVGKSWLADYLEIRDNAFICGIAKKNDIACAYNREPIVVFDLCRSDKDFTNYTLLEAFKNGKIFSGKYKPVLKKFKSCKVVVFANFPPDEEKLSSDRWNIKSPSDF